jgi:hypothetical protein
LDALITSSTAVGEYEKFTVEQLANGFTLFKTAGGDYVSAAWGGGFPPSASDDLRTMQTVETVPANDALFTVHNAIDDRSAFQGYTIQTYYNYFLTAVGGGGKSSAAFHTDATTANLWERFYIRQCGDIGDGYYYDIEDIAATNGGGLVKNALSLTAEPNTSKFKLIRQDDGSYALQTSNGINYVTAILGGGLAHGTDTYDNLVTDRTQVQAWEKFRIVLADPDNCRYTIQTTSGYYIAEYYQILGTNANGESIGAWTLSTDISDLAAAVSLGYSPYFVLTPIL